MFKDQQNIGEFTRNSGEIIDKSYNIKQGYYIKQKYLVILTRFISLYCKYQFHSGQKWKEKI